MLAVVLAGIVVGPLASAHADQLFTESFTHPTTSQPDLSVGASGGGRPFSQVCLTASTNTGQSPIPGCTAGQASLPAADPDGSGALRFTDNENNVAGFLLSNDPLPLSAGLDISFDYYAYNGSGADGLSLFLVNGASTLTAPGANGGSLGYAQRNASPGVANGYLGVGLDEYGNFTNDTESRGTGCATRSPLTGLHKNYVGLRGPGNGTTGYCYLASGPAPAPLAVPGAKTRTAAGVQQAVEIKIDPPSAPNPQVTVLVNGAQVLQAAEPAGPPPTFKFGFAASTGGATDIHEIRNLQINTINTLPKLTVTNTPVGTPVPGGDFSYTLQGQTDATAGPEAQPVTITDSLPAGVTVSSLPSGSGWDCSATVVGSSTVSCTYTPSGPLAPGTPLPPLSVATHIDPGARGPLTSTAVIASTDNANAPAQSSASATIAPMPAVDTQVAVSPPASVDINMPVAFTVTAANAGPSSSTNTTVTIPVPPGATFVSGPAGCTLEAGSVVCAVGTLAPGASAALGLVFRPSLAGSLEVRATVTQTEIDSNPADNTASGKAKVIAPAPPPLPAPPPAAPTTKTADLRVSVTPPASPPAVGQPAAFEITAANHGPDSDAGVVVSVPVPSGSTVISLSPDCRVVSDTVLCVAGALDPGDAHHFEIVVAPIGGGPLSMTATVTGDLPDLAPADNVDSAQTAVTGSPAATPVDLGVSVSARPASAPQGTVVTLTVTATDHSSAPATGVTVAIPLPPGSTPVSTPTGCTRHGTVVICRVGKLAGHHSAHFRLKIRANGRGTQGTAVTVRATQTDAKPANGHRRVTFKVTPPKARTKPKPKAKPRLSLHDSFAQRMVLGGHRARLTLTVRTTNHTTAHQVRVCDTLPRGLSVVSAPGATVHGRRVCVRLSSVGSSPRRLRIEVRTARTAHTTVYRDHATASASSAHRVSASGRLVVVPPPPPKFTG